MLLASLLLAACQPLATCNVPPVTPCATPTPTLRWDRVPDTPTRIIAGYRLYTRAPGGQFELVANLPCWLEDDGETRRCTGVDIDYPVQRVTAITLDTAEFCASAYDWQNLESPTCSNIITSCMPAIWPGPPAAYQ